MSRQPVDEIIEKLEQEGANARSRRAAERREARWSEKAERGRKARRNGREAERRVARLLGGELVPLSGALGGSWRGDVRLEAGPLRLQAQVKRTKALATQRRWLDADGSDVLVQVDPGEDTARGLVVMRVETFRSLLEAVRRGDAR
ncbi:MAG: hypothetical protein QJR08_04255 [Bacillota bacterium]|nr:hypothetical protein [Bacillota bacterium]